MEKMQPMLFTTLKNYSKEQFTKDLVAGVIVAIIALPACPEKLYRKSVDSVLFIMVHLIRKRDFSIHASYIMTQYTTKGGFKCSNLT